MQGFYTLIKTYESSVSKALSTDFDFRNLNLLERSLLPSRVLPEGAAIAPFTYPWLLEERSRKSINEFLISKNFMKMQPDLEFIPPNMATLKVSNLELSKRVDAFQKDALSAMYRLADCTAGLENLDTIRVQQCRFLNSSLTALELAKMGFMVRIIASGLFWMSETEGRADDSFIRENRCVFEDRILRFGPHFAWVHLTKNCKCSLWSQIEMNKGLVELEAFECSRLTGYSSLQCILWHAFCEKVHCSLYDSWDNAKKLVGLEIASCTLDRVTGSSV